MEKSKFAIKLLAIFLVVTFVLSFGVIGLKYFNIIQYESLNALNVIFGIFVIGAFSLCAKIVKVVVFKVWSESLKTE